MNQREKKLPYSSLEIIQFYFSNNCNLKRVAEELNVNYSKLKKEFNKILQEKEYLEKLIKKKKEKNKGFIHRRNLEEDRKFIACLISHYGQLTRTAEELNVSRENVRQKSENFYRKYPTLKKIIDKIHEKGVVKLNDEFISNKIIIATYIENYSRLGRTSKILKINFNNLREILNKLYERIPGLREVAEIGKKLIIINKKKDRKYFSDKQIIDAYISTGYYIVKASKKLGIESYNNYIKRLNRIFKENPELEQRIKKEIKRKGVRKEFQQVYSNEEMLTAFFLANANYSQAARKLRCSVRTVSYRINKIKKEKPELRKRIDEILESKSYTKAVTN